jgi:hypothetical protein
LFEISRKLIKRANRNFSAEERGCKYVPEFNSRPPTVELKIGKVLTETGRYMRNKITSNILGWKS